MKNKIPKNIFHILQIFLLLVIVAIFYPSVKNAFINTESIFLKLTIILFSIFLILFSAMITQVIIQMICVIFLIEYSGADWIEVFKIYSEKKEEYESKLETLYYLITKKLIEKNVLFLYGVKSLVKKIRDNKIIILEEDIYNELIQEITEIINKNEIENLTISIFRFKFLEKPSLKTSIMKKVWQEWKNLEHRQKIFDFIFDYLMRLAFPLIDKKE